MASKAAAIGVGIGALSLLALAGIAKAKSKPASSGGEPHPSGLKNPKCQDWYDERVSVLDQKSALNATINSLNQQISEYEQAGWGTPEDLLAARAKATAQRNQLEKRANDLAVLMQDCD